MATFPTIESKRTESLGESLCDLVVRAEEIVRSYEISGASGSELRKWRDAVKRLHSAAQGPPTLGVFGESQCGKSYLISRFTTGEGGLIVQDPELAAKGSISPEKFWAEKARQDGGIRFLSFINAEEGRESTGVICRFTAHPVTRPNTPDCFVGRVLSASDLVVSLALGFHYEVPPEADTTELIERFSAKIERIREVRGEDRNYQLDGLESAWRRLRRVWGKTPYFTALVRSGFEELLDRQEQPSGEAWNELVGMLWGAGTRPSFDRLYAHLFGILERVGFPSLMDLPSRVVCSSPEGDGSGGDTAGKPLASVRHLEALFDEQPRDTVTVSFHGEGGGRRESLTRAEISAILSELILPVVLPEQNEEKSDLLDVGDVLDFPGARAAGENAAGADHSEGALLAFLRGKLTQLFSHMTERREITALCLAAPIGNQEAGSVIRPLLDEWIRSQRVGADQASDHAPPLFLAITKSDQVFRPFEARGGKRPSFGEVISDVRVAYCGREEQDWMSKWWGQETTFRDIHWVCDLAKHPIDATTETLASLSETYRSDERVIQHVDEAEAKWNALLESGGDDFLTERIRERLAESQKYRRLRAEMHNVAGLLVGHLTPHYEVVEEGEEERLARARVDATEHVEALTRVHAPTGRSVSLARFLDAVSLTPELTRRAYEWLDRHQHQMADGHPVFLDAGSFLDRLADAWCRHLDQVLDLDRAPREFVLEDRVVSSVRHYWSLIGRSQWLRARVMEVIEPLFSKKQNMIAAGSSPTLAIVRATCLAWNRQLVELGECPEALEEIELPPSLSPRSRPPWLWIRTHWERQLPEVYARTVSDRGDPPPWNEELGRVLGGVSEWRASDGH